MADIVDADQDEDTAEAGPKKLDSEDSLLRRLNRWERAARNHWSKWREEAKLSYDYVAGHQWSNEDKSALLDQMRQPVTFNRIGPMVDAVIGAEILNRQETRYSPRELGDVQVNEIITAADEWARQLADTEDEESDSFADTVICGCGWTETRMDYSEDPEGRLIDDRVDAMEMWVDPTAKKRNFADARYLFRARWRDKEDLPKEWKKKIQQATVGGSTTDDMQVGITGPRDDYERENMPIENGYPTDKRRVWIRHFQWWDYETVYRLADPMTGQVTTVPQSQVKKIGQMFLRNGMPPPPMAKIEQKKFRQAFVAGHTILEESDIEAGDFTFKAITGKRDRNTNTFYGVVRAMIDPQMWGNKFFVQIMHILNTSARGGLLYESNSFADPRKAIQDWAKPDAPIELTRGALSGQAPAVKERTAVNFPNGTDRMMEFALNNLPQTSGINLELLGLVQRDQPGVLEMHRKRAGYAILAVFFDSLRRYRKMKGRLRLYFIQNYISDGRLVRIKGKDNTEQYIPLVKQPGTATYDVIVDEAPMSPNQKEQTWQMMQAMMPMLSKLAVPPEVWSLMLEYSPLPSSVSGKINEALKKQAEKPPAPDPKLIEGQQKMQIQAQKSQLDMFAEQQDMQHKREMQQLELQSQITETHTDLIESDIKRQSMREKAAIDMTVARARAQQAMKPKKAAK